MPATKKQATPNIAPVIHSIRERAMLVQLSLSRWNGRRADENTAKEILKTKKADEDAGTFSKRLVPKEALGKVLTAYNALRNAFKKMTLPWDDGVGVLKAENFVEFSQATAKLVEHFDAACDHFAAEYKTLLQGAPARLGKLFTAGDFPTPESIRSKFKVKVTVLPIPDTQDFRISLSDEAMVGVQQGLLQHLDTKIKQAQQDLWFRVLDVIQHFSAVMAEPDAKFKDSTVHNLTQIAEEVQSLGIIDDPKLDSVLLELRKLAAKTVPDELRENKVTRKAAADEAADTVKRIERMMAGAF